MNKNTPNLIFLFLFFVVAISGCSQEKLFSYSVDEVAKNPRLYEGKVVSLKGVIHQTDNVAQIAGISARISSPSGSTFIYLSNMSAKVQFGREVVVNGELNVINIPLLGTYIVVDAKSVVDCSEKIIC